jgi:hypothetical protein
MTEMLSDLQLADMLGNRMGPTVSKDSIEAQIKEELFLQPQGTTLTICVLTLTNGFTVTGESACADPANFDVDIGKKIARDDAFNHVWPLEGYLLRERMYQHAKLTEQQARDAEIAEAEAAQASEAAAAEGEA